MEITFKNCSIFRENKLFIIKFREKNYIIPHLKIIIYFLHNEWVYDQLNLKMQGGSITITKETSTKKREFCKKFQDVEQKGKSEKISPL